MNNCVYIGIDNGCTGTIGIIAPDEEYIITTPIKKEQKQTKKKGNISRLDFDKFYDLLDMYPISFVAFERPLMNSHMFNATISGVRLYEAQLVAVERLKIPHITIDSKIWQREFFPLKCESGQTKELSNQVGRRLFPKLINPYKDYDGLLIAKFIQLKQY